MNPLQRGNLVRDGVVSFDCVVDPEVSENVQPVVDGDHDRVRSRNETPAIESGVLASTLGIASTVYPKQNGFERRSGLAGLVGGKIGRKYMESQATTPVRSIFHESTRLTSPRYSPMA